MAVISKSCHIDARRYDARMREIARLLLHLLTTVARLVRPGGARSVVAESLLLKHQLLILNRQRARAPNLRSMDQPGSAGRSLQRRRQGHAESLQRKPPAHRIRSPAEVSSRQTRSRSVRDDSDNGTLAAHKVDLITERQSDVQPRFPRILDAALSPVLIEHELRAFTQAGDEGRLVCNERTRWSAPGRSFNSFIRFWNWWSRRGSNPRPPHCESDSWFVTG